MEDNKAAVSRLIDSYQNDMVATMAKMIGFKAVSPDSGGTGEGERAGFLEKWLEQNKIPFKRFSYKDSHGIERPNIIAKFGDKPRTTWIVAHMDTVSEGDKSLWKTDPYKAHVQDGRVYGRGASDNGQGVIGALYALKAIKESGIETSTSIGIALVADEEVGSRFGICKLLDEGVFQKEDFFLVPDSGTVKGDEIEVAEKGILWLRITVSGKQVHASVPDHGVNAYRYASILVNQIDKQLHRKYNATNPLFEPKSSTFEMTKHEANVDSVNIIPGTDVSYIDCRVLPQYNLEEIISEVKSVAEGPEFKRVKIRVEIYNREDAAPPTNRESEVVKKLEGIIRETRGIAPRVIGIGGGTCAAFFRKRGFQTVVWATLGDQQHQPNEYCTIQHMVDDTKVFALLCV